MPTDHKPTDPGATTMELRALFDRFDAMKAEINQCCEEERGHRQRLDEARLRREELENRTLELLRRLNDKAPQAPAATGDSVPRPQRLRQRVVTKTAEVAALATGDQTEVQS